MPKPEFERPRGTGFLWLCMALIVACWGWSAYVQMPSATPECVPKSQEQGDKQAKYEDCAALRRALVGVGFLVHDYREEIGAISTAIIAAYTIILGRATIGLRNAAEQQRTDTLRAIKAAERAAKATKRSVKAMRDSEARQATDFKASIAAAELSAQAAINVELPFLFIDRVSVNPRGGASFEEWTRRLTADVVISNYGRTPAFVTKVVVNLHVGDASLTVIPTYRHRPTASENFVITNGTPHTVTEYRCFEKSNIANEMTLDLFETLLNGDAGLYIYGLIEFRDFMDKPHTSGVHLHRR